MVATDTSALFLGMDSRVVAVVVALISLCGSVWSLIVSTQAKKLNEKETAKAAYRRYLELGFQHPKLVSEDAKTGFVEYEKFSGDEATSYRMFIAILLNGCEEILERSNDNDWRTVVTRQLRQHKPYLATMNEDRCQQYDARLRDLMRPLVGGNW